jgi:hypothetical protein
VVPSGHIDKLELKEFMSIKKTWAAPILVKYGSIEQLTQLNYADLHQISQSFLPEQALGLLASLTINP